MGLLMQTSWVTSKVLFNNLSKNNGYFTAFFEITDLADLMLRLSSNRVEGKM